MTKPFLNERDREGRVVGLGQGRECGVSKNPLFASFYCLLTQAPLKSILNELQIKTQTSVRWGTLESALVTTSDTSSGDRSISVAPPPPTPTLPLRIGDWC